MKKATTQSVDNLLNSLYYKVGEPSGYGGVNQLVLEANRERNVPRSVVTHWLHQQAPHRRHKPARKHFPRNPTLTRGIDHIWQADLVDVQDLKSKNRPYNYILTVIDTLSRFVWAVPLRNKTGQVVTRAFHEIFTTSGRKPVKICTDMGKEFTNKIVQDFLNKNNVFHYTVASDTKASMVERFNRTLKDRMWKYFTHRTTYRYTDTLQDFVRSYNNRKHRIIGMSPVEVNKKNEKPLWQKLYPKKKLQKPKLKVGDRVLLAKDKGPFEKGYWGRWTNEAFTIDQVKVNQQLPMYVVKDDRGESIKGAFYEQQLQKVEHNGK